MLRRASVLVFIAVVSCASVAHESDVLYFGTAIPGGGTVSAAEWRAFVDEVITPRFPGFTEWEAEGHWKNEHERTHVVQIVRPPGAADDAKVNEIADEYKRRFHQEAVLIVRSRASMILR